MSEQVLYKQGSWYPFHGLINYCHSYSHRSIKGDPYISGFTHQPILEKEGYIYVAQWHFSTVQDFEFDRWLIAFMTEEDFSHYQDCLSRKETDAELHIFGAIASDDVARDLATLEQMFDPMPIYESVYFMQHSYEMIFLFSAISSSHMNNKALIRTQNELEKAQQTIYEMQASKVAHEAKVTVYKHQKAVAEKELSSEAHKNVTIALENEELRKELSRLKRKLSAKDRTGYVYLLKVKNRDDVYKIGRTKNPDNRLRTFSVKLPFPVHYEHLIQCDDMYDLESELHARYADKRLDGEFFRLTPTDVQAIKTIGDEWI